ATMNGASMRTKREIARCSMPASSFRCALRRSPCAAKLFRSPPTQNMRPAPVRSTTRTARSSLERIATCISSCPISPSSALPVTERPGRLNLIGRDFKRTNVEGVPRVYASGQGGLLEVALHPRFAANGFIYLSYAGPGDGGASTELARGRLEGNRLVDLRVLF